MGYKCIGTVPTISTVFQHVRILPVFYYQIMFHVTITPQIKPSRYSFHLSQYHLPRNICAHKYKQKNVMRKKRSLSFLRYFRVRWLMQINSVLKTTDKSVTAELTILANVTDNQARYRCEAHNSATEIPLFETKTLSVHCKLFFFYIKFDYPTSHILKSVVRWSLLIFISFMFVRFSCTGNSENSHRTRRIDGRR